MKIDVGRELTRSTIEAAQAETAAPLAIVYADGTRSCVRKVR